MHPRHWRIVFVAVVCVLAISLAAATLDSAVQRGSNSGAGGADVSAPPPASTGGQGGGAVGPPCVSWLATPLSALVLFGVLGAGALLVHSRYSRFETLAFTVGLGIPVVSLYLLLTACETAGPRQAVVQRLREWPVVEAASDAGNSVEPAIPSILLASVLIAGVILTAVLLYFSFADVSESEPAGTENQDTDAAAVAQAAGDAAERIERGGDLENEIHRAWREMTTHLDVPRPETSTPGEFATAAIETGFDPEPVRELTELFEAVRYGGFEPTADREARARKALQQIEDSYDSPAGGSDRNTARDD